MSFLRLMTIEASSCWASRVERDLMAECALGGWRISSGRTGRDVVEIAVALPK